MSASADTLVASTDRRSSERIEDDPIIAAALCGFRGRIVGTAGEPLERCEVRIHRFSFDRLTTAGVFLLGDRGPGPGIVHRSATTGADGRFLVSGVWPRGMYFLVGDNPAHGRMLRLVDRAPGPGEVVDLGDLVLLADATITGSVVAENGEPLADARVRAVDLPGAVFAIAPLERFDPEGALLLRDRVLPVAPVISMPSWLRELYAELPIAMTRTDASGRFRLTGVMPGENAVIVDCAAWMPVVKAGIRVSSRSSHDVGSIRLRRGEQLVGHVVDVNGDAVAGAEVLVAPTSANMQIDFAVAVAPTDIDGRFDCGGLPPGRVTVAVRRSRDHEWSVVAPQPVSGDVVVRLPAVCELELIVNSRSGARIDDLQLEILRGELSRPSIAFRMIGLQDPVDLAGRVTRQSATTWRVADLEPGFYVVAVASAGHARLLRNVSLPTAEPIEFELDQQQIHDVRVVDRNGAPVRYAEVFAEPNASRDMVDMPLPINCGRTDAEGRLRVDGVNHPEVRVSVTHPAYGMVAVVVQRTVRDVVVTLDQPGAIDGETGQGNSAPSVPRNHPPVRTLWDRPGDASPAGLSHSALPERRHSHRPLVQN